MGRHAVNRGIWFAPLPWALLSASLLFSVLVLRHVPCVQVDPGNAVNAFIRVCYSDIQTTFLGRNYGLGGSPVVGNQLPDSPLVAVVMTISLFIVRMVGGVMGPTATPQQVIDSSVAFFVVSALVLFLSFLLLVVAVAYLGPRAPGQTTSWHAFVFAASPVVLAAGLINWTLLPLALTALGLMQMARRRLFEAGVVLGLAACAGTMPIVVVLALIVVTGLRGGPRAAGKFGAAAVVAFVLVHAPLLLSNSEQVYAYYNAEINKETSYGSIGYLLELIGLKLRGLGALTFSILALLLVIAMLAAYVTKRQPRVGSAVAVAVLLATVLAPTFSPQMGLWVLFATWLARPYRRELVAVTVTQVAYCVAIWGWLGGGMSSGEGPNLLYCLALVLQVGAQLWVLLETVSDIASPERDRLRTPDVPDPIGGELCDAELAVIVEPTQAEPQDPAPRRSMSTSTAE